MSVRAFVVQSKHSYLSKVIQGSQELFDILDIIDTTVQRIFATNIVDANQQGSLSSLTYVKTEYTILWKLTKVHLQLESWKFGGFSFCIDGFTCMTKLLATFALCGLP